MKNSNGTHFFKTTDPEIYADYSKREQFNSNSN